MKQLFAILLCSVSFVAFSDDSQELFDESLEEAASIQELSNLADREEQITRAAKAIHERHALGLDYNLNDGWVEIKKTNTKTGNDVETNSFRFPDVSQKSDELPTVAGVFGKKVNLLFQGSSGSYTEGDRVGGYHIQKIDITKIVLRDDNGKQVELSTDW